MSTQGKVLGSYGELTIDLNTGDVLSVEHYNGCEPEYSDIVRFDLAEYRSTYPNEPDCDEFDILDVGFWTNKGLYASPDEFHREQVANYMQSIIGNEAVGSMLKGS